MHICALTTTGDAKLPKFSQLKFLARNKNDEKSYAAIDDRQQDRKFRSTMYTTTHLLMHTNGQSPNYISYSHCNHSLFCF